MGNDSSFKDCYDQNAMKKPYQDPETGAHFYYPDVCKRLKLLQLNSHERLDENICQIAEEGATSNILTNYQTTGSKKFLKSLKERYPGTRYVQTCVEDSKQRMNTFCFKNKHSIIQTSENGKILLEYSMGLNCKNSNIRTDKELVLSNKKTNMMGKVRFENKV